MEDMPKLKDYIIRLQYWRDVYERSLDDRGRTQSLDMNGCNLNEFHLTKFDEVDVPGQYLQHIDPTDELVKITRFAPSVELGRGHGHCFRRITIIGSNSAPYTFVVQMPAARHCRREDRLIAFFRIMNSVLAKRKESRRRNLQFHLPTAVAFAHQLRLVQSDSTYVSLQDILDEHCRSMNMSREDSTIKFYERIKALHDPSIPAVSFLSANALSSADVRFQTDPRFLTLKIEVMEEIQTKYIPDNILTKVSSSLRSILRLVADD
jgi:transformation/transcription domain-associated protein